MKMYIARMEQEELIVKGIYRHYRNGEFYEVTGIAYNADNDAGGDPLEKPYVLYKPCYNNSTWVRPLAQFNEELEHEGQTVRRFSFVKNSL